MIPMANGWRSPLASFETEFLAKSGNLGLQCPHNTRQLHSLDQTGRMATRTRVAEALIGAH